MRLWMHIALFVVLASAVRAQAEVVRENYEGMRPTGMGGAFLAVADDDNVLWYNPAGLANIKGLHWNVLDLNVGFDSSDTMSRIGGALNGNTANIARPDTEMFQGGLRTGFFMPCFGIQIFDNMHGFYDLQNLSNLNASVDVDSKNDIGIAAGLALPMSPYFSIGATARAFERIGADMHLTAQDLINDLGITATDLSKAVFTEIQKKAGTGYALGVDVGSMLTLPLPKDYPTIRFAAVAEDVGETTFHALGSKNAPQSVPMSYHFGASVKYDLSTVSRRGGSSNTYFLLAADWRHAFDPNISSYVKTIHVGAEYHINPISLRLGLYEGYPSAGFSLEFPPHTRLIFTTYEPELGSSLWERGQRWYLLQLVIGFKPI